MQRLTAAVIAVGIIAAHGPAFARSTPTAVSTLSRQNQLIGATAAIQSSANNGAGVTVGVIDTGVQAGWTGFGSIDAANAACLIWACSSNLALNDDNGHGTFVAGEIAANLPGAGLVGVAPQSTVLPVKVMNMMGAGYSSDIASGITYAADHGAKVLNISIGPSGTADDRASFFQTLASAVNYAAAKGATIVFAGGNDATTTLGTLRVSGFTDAALQNMIFVGSTNASMRKSSFSNTPGTGGFISSTGQFYALDRMWVMADGENMTGASFAYDAATQSYDKTVVMSGTSMAAPQAAGAAALLAARWPYLAANGTITQILEASAKDLGAKGIDAIYGDGFLRVDLAMAPIGDITTPVSGSTGSGSTSTTPSRPGAKGGRNARGRTGGGARFSGSAVVASTAFGNMSGLSKALSHAYGYDSFGRDYSLAGLASITSKGSGAGISQATRAVMGQTAAAQRQVVSLDGGNWLAFSGSPAAPSKDALYIQSDPGQYVRSDWTYAFAEGDTYFGGGHGDGAKMLFNDARWGRDSAFFGTDTAASGALLGLVPDADFSVMAHDLASGGRFSAGYVKSGNNNFQGFNENEGASGAFVNYTFSPIKHMKVALTVSDLSEKNMLLGTQSSGALALAGAANSSSYGVGTSYNLGHGVSLGFDAAYAITNPSASQNSMIGGMSRLESQALSFNMSKRDIAVPGDKLGFEVGKPLRVFSGSANMTAATGTDANGNPIITSQHIGLTPGGSETDFNIIYSMPLDPTTTGSVALSARHDADDIRGENDVAGMIRLKHSF